MPYALIDDQMYDHPKFNACSDTTVGIWTRGLAWCCRHLTDGHITRADFLRLSSGGAKAVDKAIREMTENGLLDVLQNEESGYSFHDFSHYNPSGSQVRARRAEISEARSQAGKKGMATRWGHNKPDNKPITNPQQTDNPVPVPVPPLVTPTESSSPTRSRLLPPNESVGVCATCDCATDRPGTHVVNGIDTICDHQPPTAAAYLA